MFDIVFNLHSLGDAQFKQNIDSDSGNRELLKDNHSGHSKHQPFDLNTLTSTTSDVLTQRKEVYTMAETAKKESAKQDTDSVIPNVRGNSESSATTVVQPPIAHESDKSKATMGQSKEAGKSNATRPSTKGETKEVTSSQTSIKSADKEPPKDDSTKEPSKNKSKAESSKNDSTETLAKESSKEDSTKSETNGEQSKTTTTESVEVAKDSASKADAVDNSGTSVSKMNLDDNVSATSSAGTTETTVSSETAKEPEVEPSKPKLPSEVKLNLTLEELCNSTQYSASQFASLMRNMYTSPAIYYSQRNYEVSDLCSLVGFQLFSTAGKVIAVFKAPDGCASIIYDVKTRSLADIKLSVDGKMASCKVGSDERLILLE